MTEAYDNSMLSCFSQCELKYYLQYVLHRRAAQERIATALGTMLHEISDNNLKGNFITDKDALQRIYSKHTEMLSGIEDQTLRDNTLAKYNIAMKQLLDTYPIDRTPNGTIIILDPKTGQERYIVRYSEIAFQQEIAPGYNYSGRVDWILEDRNNLLYIWDLKTSGNAKHATWQLKWRVDSQLKGYVYCIGLQVAKLIAGAIIAPLAMNLKTAEMLPEIRINYTPKALGAWRVTAIAQIKQINLKREIATYWEPIHEVFSPTGMLAGSCSNNTLGICDYFDYCRTEFNQGILMQSTIEKVWNPLEKVKES
jgi:hypothetical protein